MNDCDALLREVTAQAVALGIPVSQKVEPHVVINTRAATRFGCCIFDGKTGRFRIEVARRVAEGTEMICRELWLPKSWEAVEGVCGENE